MNPKHWHELADMYVARARQDNSDLSGLLIDIDATKAANDELGHESGNQLIDMVDELTTMIPQQVRHDSKSGGGRLTDAVTYHSSEPSELTMPGLVLPEPQTARIGGDEFGILLPLTGKVGVQVVKERLLEAVNQKLRLPEYRQLAELGVGVSIGVATLEPNMKTSSDFLRAIDRAMYRDKIDQLPPLSPVAQAEFVIAMEHLKKAGIRPRDVPKYIQKFGETALAQAFESLDKAGQTDQADQAEPVDKADQPGQADL